MTAIATALAAESFAKVHPETKRIFTALDRCDACGAQAYASTNHMHVSLRDGELTETELLFCAHHFKRFNKKLMLDSISHVDHTEDLYQFAKPDASA